MEQFTTMIYSVAIALALSAALFIGGNMVINQVRQKWAFFTSSLGLLVGILLGAILQHNGITKWGGDLWWRFENGWAGIALWGVIGIAGGWMLGDRVFEPPLYFRTRFQERLRPIVFVGPTIVFLMIGLVIPAGRTIWLSFKEGRRGEGGLSLTWYEDIFTDDGIWNVNNFADIFTSRLFIFGLGLVLAGGLLAWSSAQRFSGGTVGATATWVARAINGLAVALITLSIAGFFEALVRTPNQSYIVDGLTVLVSSQVTLWIIVVLLVGAIAAWAVRRQRRPGEQQLDVGSPGASLSVVLAIILLLFAALSTLQATIWNNLWWVVTVAGVSTVMGLLLAILAERARADRFAKTMIFMPMAISMVGAAVIWDFMYEVQPTGNQTGLINAILQGLGFQARGFFINSTMIPWNNIWIMLIMVWIQVGFAMVILSAAIKAVPEELMEAARVDGANEIQVFWRVVIPQIRPTIIVVVTTLIIIIMKVFDVVKATTNGANNTDVLANAMFNQLRDRNFALSSAFAVLILALTLPVMIFNIRRTQKEQAL